MSFVEVGGLRVAYGAFVAVRGISFAIPAGAVFGFIGPNGAGKTSTIRVMATVQQPSAGFVRIGSLSVRGEPAKVRRIVGYMPDTFGTYDDLDAEQYLRFFAAAYEVEPRRRARVIDEVLALTELGDLRRAPVESLSRGMRQRLSLARALLHDPPFLLLDEPSSGLDPRSRLEFRRILKDLQSLGKTVLISSHILHELAQICTRIGIIEAGRLVAEGSLAEILSRLELHRRVQVQAADIPADCCARLAAVPGVVAAERQDDRIIIQVREGRLAMEDLHQVLVGMGCRLRMFQPEDLDLETAFVRLTEGRLT